MRRNFVEIYALAVCFCALLCFTVAFGIGSYDIVQIAAPEFTLSSDESSMEYSGRFCKDSSAVIGEQRSAAQSLTKVAIILIIDSAIFLIHWRMAGRIRKKAQES